MGFEISHDGKDIIARGKNKETKKTDKYKITVFTVDSKDNPSKVFEYDISIR
jgi:hypothetical protein